MKANDIDNGKCLLCYYHGHNSSVGVICDYLMITGKMRGCEPGKDCKRFKAGIRDPKEAYRDSLGK